MKQRYMVKSKELTRPSAYFANKEDAEKYADENNMEVTAFNDYILFMNWFYPLQKRPVWEGLLQQSDKVLMRT